MEAPPITTYFDLLGCRIAEPVTVLTDILLSVFCFYFYNKLHVAKHQTELGKYWRFFFLFIGLSTFIGAVAHGLKEYMPQGLFHMVWMTMNLISIPSSYYLLKVTITLSHFTEEKKKNLSSISLVGMCFLGLFTIIYNQFDIIKINAAVVILLTLVRHYHSYKRGYTGCGYIFFGFAFSLLSVIVHSLKISYSEWFNFKDISHVIMNISLYIIFTGVLLKINHQATTIEANS